MKRNSLNSRSPRPNKKRKPINFSRIFFRLVSLIFVGSVLYLLFFSPFMQISNLEIRGNEEIPEEIIRERIKSEISGHFLGIFKKDNFILANSQKIEKLMLADFRQIRTLEIKKKFPSKMEVLVFERIPSVIVCGENCLVLDENGEAYDEKGALDNSKAEDLLELEDLSRKKNYLGEIVLEVNYVNYLKFLKQEISEELVAIEKEIETPSLVSKDIRVRTKEGWSIFFNENIDADKELEMLSVVLKNKINQNQRVDLEYVDLRIDNKVFYKFKDETESEKARLSSLEASSFDDKAVAPAEKESAEKDKR